MAYKCPCCFARCWPDAPRCPRCGVRLEPASSAFESGPASQLVRIRIFSGPRARLEAALARNVLEAEGIISFLPGQFSSEALPGVDRVQLLVPADVADQADEVLKGFLDNPAAAKYPAA